MRVILQPNETRTIHKAGYSVYLLDAAGLVEVSIDNETEELQAGQGIPSNGVMFREVRLKNLEAVAQTVDLHIASNNRGIVSNRLSGEVKTQETAAGTVQALPSVTVGTSAKTIAGNLDRKRLVITADSANMGTVWIGSATAGQGVPLPAGAVYLERIGGDLSVIATMPGDTVHLGEVV